MCAWTLAVPSGAPLLLLAGKKGLLLAVNALTGTLEVGKGRGKTARAWWPAAQQCATVGGELRSFTCASS